MTARSRWKVPYIATVFFVKGLRKKRLAIKTRNRSSAIPSCLTSKSFYVYNGRKYMSVIIKPGMKGFKFGEFSFTKVYGLKKKKKIKKLR
jgi:ribosomal protein S19